MTEKLICAKSLIKLILILLLIVIIGLFKQSKLKFKRLINLSKEHIEQEGRQSPSSKDWVEEELEKSAETLTEK